MIQTENVTISGRDFIHTWSDEHYYILQEETGLLYEEAYDLVEYPYTYKETAIPIDDDEPEDPGDETPIDAETIEKAQAYDILMGGESDE